MAELKERYATALFDLSLENDMLETYMEQASFVRDVLQDEECESFLLHPHIPDKAKQELFNNLFSDKISKDLMGFLYLTVAKSREMLIIPTLTAYIDMGNRHKGKVIANVVSAAKLREDQILAIHTILSRKLNKSVEIVAQVEPDLIGGFYIHVDGRLIDRTVKTQLKNMKKSLKKRGATDGQN